MRRTVLSIGSTIVSGLANILIQLVAAALLPADEYGLFAVMAATILLIVGLGRTIIGQVDVIRGGEAHGPIASATLIFAGGAAAVGAIAAIIPIPSQTYRVTTLAVLMSAAFVLQDLARFRAFAVRRPQVALVSDSVALVLAILGLGAIFLLDWPRSAVSVAGAWAAAMLIGAVPAALMLRYRPGPVRGGRDWLKAGEDLWKPGLGEFGLQTGLPYLLNFLILAVAGPVALGGYRLMQMLFAATGNIAQGINATTLPEIARAKDDRTGSRLYYRNILANSGIGILAFGAVYLTSGSIMPSMFGAAWSAAMPFLVVCAVHALANAVAIPVYGMLRVSGQAMFSFRVRLLTVGLTLLGSIAAFAAGSALLIAWAIAIPACLGVALRHLKVVSTRKIASLNETRPAPQ